jgi:hypothetical protein
MTNIGIIRPLAEGVVPSTTGGLLGRPRSPICALSG